MNFEYLIWLARPSRDPRPTVAPSRLSVATANKNGLRYLWPAALFTQTQVFMVKRRRRYCAYSIYMYVCEMRSAEKDMGS